MSQTFFITGTSTEVGKTFVSCAILAALEKLGKSTSAMKPIASGCDWQGKQLRNADALALQHYASQKIAYDIINPYAFEPAIAPHIAAQQAGVEIKVEDLLVKTREFLRTDAEISLIEGAGGWRVPLNEKEDLSDYVKGLNVPVILVVSVSLGCINHALLSVESIEAKGLKLAAWVANISPHAGNNPNQENIESIAKRIKAPLLASIPFFHGENQHQNIQLAADKLIENNFLEKITSNISK